MAIKRKPRRKKRPTIKLQDQIMSGVYFVDTWSNKAVKEDGDNPVLAAMTNAIIATLQQTLGRKLGEDLGIAVGVSMLAAFVYGQDAGAKVERSKLAIEACLLCYEVSNGAKWLEKSKKTDGVWRHKTENGYDECDAAAMWERGINNDERTNNN